MTEHLKITIETDLLSEPIVLERDVVPLGSGGWRYEQQNELAEYVLPDDGGNRRYEIVGGSLYVSWRVPRK